jgi:DDE superfamily endonuclease
VTVDGIHCEIFEPQDGMYSKNPKYYSCKFNKAALCYEIAISIFTNQIVWVNGPFPAGTGDQDGFRKGLQAMIPPGKKVVADSAYKAKYLPMIVTTNNADSHKVKKFKACAKCRQETFNAKMKHFNILNQRFRSGVHNHKTCFEACLVLCAYQIECSAPHFDV